MTEREQVLQLLFEHRTRFDSKPSERAIMERFDRLVAENERLRKLAERPPAGCVPIRVTTTGTSMPLSGGQHGA
jgi:hypothetical protein